MSSIYYKLRSAKESDYDVFTFDGPGATVFDLKREIIRAKKFGKGTEFDIAIYNAQTEEGIIKKLNKKDFSLIFKLEYKDDVFVIPRNTSIIVRRLPASRPGKGTAQRYVLGVLPTDGKGQGFQKGAPPPPTGAQFNPGRNMVLNAVRPTQAKATPEQPVQEADDGPKDDSEEARIQAMFQQTTDQWGAMQERLAE